MEYEFRIWNVSDKDLSGLQPEAAKDWLQTTADSVNNLLGQGNHNNPDILIDTKTLGEGTLALADISYINEKIEVGNEKNISFCKNSH